MARSKGMVQGGEDLTQESGFPPPASDEDVDTALVISIAVTAHEVNRAYCEAIGDLSQRPWSEASDHQQASAIDGVRYLMAHPDATPVNAHANWCDAKRADGWTFGPAKDEVAKTHPNLQPYDRLPVEQKAKDYIFSALVKRLLLCNGMIKTG